MRKVIASACMALMGVCAFAQFQISIGVRETAAGGGTDVGVGNNGGTAGGIEWINRDGQTLPFDGNWHQFTFTLASDPVIPFAGGTANGILEGAFGVLEHIRILNNAGVTTPVEVFIDDVANTFTPVGGGPTTVTFGDFEGFAVGQEVIFQEPSFSGSTSSNLLPGSTSAVTDAMALNGIHSYALNFQFVDNTPTRWVRLTSFNTPNVPNPMIRFDGGSVVTFSMKVVPEPGTFAVLGLGALALLRRRKKS